MDNSKLIEILDKTKDMINNNEISEHTKDDIYQAMNLILNIDESNEEEEKISYHDLIKYMFTGWLMNSMSNNNNDNSQTRNMTGDEPPLA